MTSPDRTQEFLGLRFDRLDLGQALRALAARPAEAPFAYLVTPNVDHMVRLFDEGDDQRGRIWQAYRGADWCLCDSRILARLAALRGVRLPVVPGSDLAACLIEGGVLDGRRVAIVGGDGEAVAQLRRRFAQVRFVHHEPPFGLRHDEAAMAAAADFVAASQADFVFLSVGSPQQELLAAKIRENGRARGIGLCLGAAIDFLTERQKRAPVLLQRLHLEWAHRLAVDPRRLWRRYLVTGPRIFALVRRWQPGHDPAPPK